MFIVNLLANFLKICVLYFLRFIFRIFWIFPVRENKIVFQSHGGKQYSCNPKYIFEYVISHYGNRFEYVWAANSLHLLPPEYRGIKTVKYLSLRYLFHVMTAGLVIHNAAVKAYLPFRKRQIIVNTWHGGSGAYKKIGLDALPYKEDFVAMMVTRKISARTVKYVIASCQRFTTMRSKTWAVPVEKFLPIGSPRNDILFASPDTVKSKVRDHFNLKDDMRIVLYAPTFRGDYRNADKMDFSLDIPQTLSALKAKFGANFVFLYRSHHSAAKNQSGIAHENIIPASDYPDMQELLCIADVLITDYSSSMWDFSFTFRPCFLFTPDLEDYQAKQGFYTPIEEWPFPHAETNDQFMHTINNFDQEKYVAAVKAHHKALGSYEQGTATKQLCDLLFENFPSK